MLKNSHHRLGNINYNQIKQLNYNNECLCKLNANEERLCVNNYNDTHIQVNEIVLDELELIHEAKPNITSDSFYDNLCDEINNFSIEPVYQIKTCGYGKTADLLKFINDSKTTLNSSDDNLYNTIPLKDLQVVNDYKTTLNSSLDNLCANNEPVIKVSSQVEKMELVIKQQKTIRKLNRKNSW